MKFQRSAALVQQEQSAAEAGFRQFHGREKTDRSRVFCCTHTIVKPGCVDHRPSDASKPDFKGVRARGTIAAGRCQASRFTFGKKTIELLATIVPALAPLSISTGCLNHRAQTTTVCDDRSGSGKGFESDVKVGFARHSPVPHLY